MTPTITTPVKLSTPPHHYVKIWGATIKPIVLTKSRSLDNSCFKQKTVLTPPPTPTGGRKVTHMKPTFKNIEIRGKQKRATRR